MKFFPKYFANALYTTLILSPTTEHFVHRVKTDGEETSFTTHEEEAILTALKELHYSAEDNILVIKEIAPVLRSEFCHKLAHHIFPNFSGLSTEQFMSLLEGMTPYTQKIQKRVRAEIFLTELSSGSFSVPENCTSDTLAEYMQYARMYPENSIQRNAVEKLVAENAFKGLQNNQSIVNFCRIQETSAYGRGKMIEESVKSVFLGDYLTELVNLFQKVVHSIPRMDGTGVELFISSSGTCSAASELIMDALTELLADSDRFASVSENGEKFAQCAEYFLEVCAHTKVTLPVRKLSSLKKSILKMALEMYKNDLPNLATVVWSIMDSGDSDMNSRIVAVKTLLQTPVKPKLVQDQTEVPESTEKGATG